MLATILRRARNVAANDQRDFIAREIATYAQKENERFKRDIFLSACNVKDA